MNILHINFDVEKYYPYWKGGVPSVVHNIMKYSDKYQKAKMGHSLLTLSNEVSEYTTRGNVHLLPLSARRENFMFNPSFIYSITRNIDIIHCHHPLNINPLSKLLIKMLSGFKIRIVESIYTRPVPENNHWRKMNNILTDKFVVIDNDLKECTINNGYAASKVQVIPVFPDLELFDPGRLNFPKSSARAEDSLTFWFSAGPRKEMGLYYLLEQIKRICEAKESGCNHKFLITVVPMPENKKVFNEVRDYIEKYKLYNTELLPTFYDDLALFLNSVDAVIFPIQEHIGKMNTPLMMLESMAMGKLIIATPTGGIPEVLNQNNAIIFDPNKIQLYQVITGLNSYDISSLQEDARKTVLENYDPQKIAQLMYEFYSEIL